jgi:hypothetical protein
MACYVKNTEALIETNSMILLHDTKFGKLWLDVNMRCIFFDNNHKKIKLRITDSLPALSESSKNAINFTGMWRKNFTYVKDNIVLDESVDCMYISLSKFTSLDKPSEDMDENHWLQLTRFPIFTGKWHSDTTYLQNQIVSRKDGIYIAKRNVIKENFVTDDWSQIFSTSDIKLPIFYSLLASKEIACCLRYYSDEGKSMILPCKEHSDPDINIWDERILSPTSFDPIVFPIIAKCDEPFYEFVDRKKSIHISHSGIYKITYNIEFHGSIHMLHALACIKNDLIPDAKTEAIKNSSCRYWHRPKNDSESDDVYCDSENLGINTSNIQHSFVLPLEVEPVSYQLTIGYRVYGIDKGKLLYLHPLSSWILIERLS